MTRNNEAAVFCLAFLTTLGLVGVGIWLVTQKFSANTSVEKSLSQSTPSNTVPPEPPDSFAKVNNIPTGLFSYGGSMTWAPIRGQVDPVIQIIWPQSQSRYIEPTNGVPGSGAGIKMLLNNQLAFSHSSRSLKNEEYQQAQVKGFALKEISVAIDGIAIAVNSHLNIPGLTVALGQKLINKTGFVSIR